MQPFSKKSIDELHKVGNFRAMNLPQQHKKQKGTSRVVRGISWEPEVLTKAIARASHRRQSLSAYVNSLTAQDIFLSQELTTLCNPPATRRA
jgi:hypothetical protein